MEEPDSLSLKRQLAAISRELRMMRYLMGFVAGAAGLMLFLPEQAAALGRWGEVVLGYVNFGGLAVIALGLAGVVLAAGYVVSRCAISAETVDRERPNMKL